MKVINRSFYQLSKENHRQNRTLNIRNVGDCLILTIHIFENETDMHIILNFQDRIASNEFNGRNCIQLDWKHTLIFGFDPFVSLWPLLWSKPYELGLIRLKVVSRKNLRKEIRYKSHHLSVGPSLTPVAHFAYSQFAEYYIERDL